MSSTSLFTFSDLFAGVGGFHAAMKSLGGRCAYAVEIDRAAAQVYRHNWGRDPLGDIRADASDSVMNVPRHDVLTAGFPCQPFSKSGSQRGMEETRGTLYYNILRIVQERRPTILLLENVRNLAGPRHMHEWQVIVETLRDEGYRVSDSPAMFSPHLLPPELGGRPQVRERVFVTATYNPHRIGENLPVDPVATLGGSVEGWDPANWDLVSDLPLDENHDISGCELTDAQRLWINAWDDFVRLMKRERGGRRLPGFPIWADSWAGARGPISDLLPPWKVNFLGKNHALYLAHSEVLDAWAERWGVFTDAFPASRRKLEWQAQDVETLWETVMHLRPSGIRAKRPTYLPALVAMAQTSVVGSRERRLSPREVARLQGLPDSFDFGGASASSIYRQMGNGVNVGVVHYVLRKHVERDQDILKTTKSGRAILDAVRASPSSPDDVLRRHVPAGL